MALPLGGGGEMPAIQEKITFFKFKKVPTVIKVEDGGFASLMAQLTSVLYPKKGVLTTLYTPPTLLVDCPLKKDHLFLRLP